MSLLKRLLLSITVVIICILVGTLVFSIDGARQYLNGQLQSQSDNAASSLALSLSQPGNQDETVRELLMLALFDSGQFQSMHLNGPDGKVLFERVMPVSSNRGEAPAWFSELLPLTKPEARRQVSDGWRQVGELSVVASDSYARDALWRSSLRVLLLVVVAGLLWALFAVLLIRWFKGALKSEISDQVRAIGEGTQAPPVRNRVAELASVGRVITTARERIRATAQEQSARIESLQLEINRDPITGLANRKYFLNELRRALSAEYSMNPVSGHVLIFRQRDLAAVNLVMTRQGVDDWLTAVGSRVMETVQAALHEPRPQLARLNGADFALLMQNATGPEATRLAQTIRQDLENMRIAMGGARLCRWAMALTDYTAESSMTTVLSRLDHGLMCAESAGHSDVEYISYSDESHDNTRLDTSQEQWHKALCDALGNDGLELSLQPVVYSLKDGVAEIAQSEAFLMMRDAERGTLLSGFMFMPAAVRLGLSDECDLRAIELGLRWLSQNSGDLVVKVSLPTLIQAEFLQDMESLFRDNSERVRRLILEIDAYGLLEHGAEVQAFCERAYRCGVRVGVRRLVQQPGALMHLHRMPIHYVKLSGDFIIDLLGSAGSQQLLFAIAQTAKALGFEVYAEDVPDDETAAMLHACGTYTLQPAKP